MQVLPFRVSSLRLQPLHPDLVNEPFAFVDTGVRPEIVVPRPFFSFKIGVGVEIGETDRGIAVCSVRNTIVSIHDGIDEEEELPEKSSTTFSIVSAYDTYGLEVAYSFLYHLYHA